MLSYCFYLDFFFFRSSYLFFCLSELIIRLNYWLRLLVHFVVIGGAEFCINLDNLVVCFVVGVSKVCDIFANDAASVFEKLFGVAKHHWQSIGTKAFTGTL